MKKESKVNQAKYVELNLFPEEKEDHQKDWGCNLNCVKACS